MSETRKAGILSLGIRRDATTWQKGCVRLGFDVVGPIKKSQPSATDLERFLARSPAWLFFGGHFGDMTLANEGGTVEIEFGDDGVTANVGGTKQTFDKTHRTFRLHEHCRVVLWGGCSVCSGRGTIRTLRTLFGRQHVLLGFAGLTGWRMVDAMLGGGFMKKRHFFTRVAKNPDDAETVVRAWMRTAWQGYGKGRNAWRFRAVDPSGQEWKLGKRGIERGRRFS